MASQVRYLITFLHDLAGAIGTVTPLVVFSTTGVYDCLAPTANGHLALKHLSQIWNMEKAKLLTVFGDLTASGFFI